MGPTPPQFDQAAAQALVAELRDGIQVLRRNMNDRAANARSLRDSWKGHYADTYFGTDQPQIKTQAQDAISHMQR